MTSLSLEIAPDIRWDDAAIKQFCEGVPYHVAGGRVTAVKGRTVSVEVSSVEIAGARERLTDLARTISRNLRDAAETVLFEYLGESVAARPDPMPALLESRAAIPTGRARFVYDGTLAELLYALDRFLETYACSVGARRQIYPTTVETASLIRSGYLGSFPQHAFFVAPVAQSAANLAAIARATEESGVDAPERSALGSHDQVLAPTVCYHCMESLRGTTLSGHQCFTAVNPCHRFEVLAGQSLERLQTFRMREIVCFGDGPYVASVLNAALEWTSATLRGWGIPHRVVTASDPFFTGAGGKGFFQSTFALKREIRVRLDFSGQWLAIASFNDHQHSLTRAFEIRGNGESPRSGCVGWGYERLVYALLARLGNAVADWPQAARAAFCGL